MPEQHALCLGTSIAARQPLDELIEQAELVEALGYASVWIPEIRGRDAVATCAILAGRTTRLRLCTGVVPLPVRSPLLLAMSAATVAEAASGRFVLGVGIGHQETVGPWFGSGGPRTLAETERDLITVRALLHSEQASGVPADLTGPRVRLHGVHHHVAPPIVLAALSPGLVRLAARVADGIVLTWVTPERVAELVAVLYDEARRVGRDPDELTVACYIPVSVTADTDAAHSQLARQIAAYVGLRAYAQSLASCGLDADVQRVVAVPSEHAHAAVSEGLLFALGAVGDVTAVQQRLDTFRAAGVALPIVAPIALRGPEAWGSLVETWSALAPR